MQERLRQIMEQKYKNKSLFDHFCELYYQIQENKYYNAQSIQYLQDFEELSTFIKDYRFYYSPLKTAEEVNNLQDQKYPWEDYACKQMQLFKQNNKQINAIIQYFPKMNQLLSQVGYGFTDEDAYNIQQCIKKIAESDNKIISIRFWGKIFAQINDYYIIEAQLDNPYKEQMPEDCEDRMNEYIHYITHDLLDEWILLPQITRQQLEISRMITYTFTGQLNREIKCYPQFRGLEKHLLKAQILRITHANLIVPRGLYRVGDEDPKIIVFEDEFKMPEATELATMDGWVHLPANILKMGRITHYVDPKLNEEQKAQILEQLTNDDPEIERLRSIKDDKPFEPNEGNWLIKIMGETQQFTNQEEGALTYQVVLLRNFLWPGAITVSTSEEFVNLYVGYGLKNQQNSFNPLSPKDLQEEPDDIQEFPDPNPQHQEEELEPDSDDERRRQQELLEQQQQQE